MAKQSLTNKIVISENVTRSLSKTFINVKSAATDIKTQQEFSFDKSVRNQLTFYQPHLCQPPKDYTLLADYPLPGSSQNPFKRKPSQNLETNSNAVENLTFEGQNLKLKQSLQYGAQSVNSVGTRESERCSTCEKDSNESVIDLRVNSQNRISAQKIGTQQPIQKLLDDTKEPLAYIKFFEEGTFIPKQRGASESKSKPNTIERGYILWELQSTDNNVLHLETKMERTIEEMFPTLEKQ